MTNLWDVIPSDLDYVSAVKSFLRVIVNIMECLLLLKPFIQGTSSLDSHVAVTSHEIHCIFHGDAGVQTPCSQELWKWNIRNELVMTTTLFRPFIFAIIKYYISKPCLQFWWREICLKNFNVETATVSRPFHLRSLLTCRVTGRAIPIMVPAPSTIFQTTSPNYSFLIVLFASRQELYHNDFLSVIYFLKELRMSLNVEKYICQVEGNSMQL